MVDEGQPQAPAQTPAPAPQINEEALAAAVERATKPLHDRIFKLSRLIDEKPWERPAAPAQEPEDGRPTVKGLQDQFEKERQALRAQQVAVKNGIIKQQLLAAANEAGVPKGRQQVLLDHIMAQAKFEVSDDLTNVVLNRPDSMEHGTPLNDFVSKLLQSPVGEAFRPPVKTPPSSPVNAFTPLGFSKTLSQMSSEERAKLTPEQVYELAGKE